VDPVAADACDPELALQHYEALRREASGLSPGGTRGQGLALLLARGMPAWLAALGAFIEPPPARATPRGSEAALRVDVLVSSDRAELARVLAGMVLACTQEVRT